MWGGGGGTESGTDMVAHMVWHIWWHGFTAIKCHHPTPGPVANEWMNQRRKSIHERPYILVSPLLDGVTRGGPPPAPPRYATALPKFPQCWKRIFTTVYHTIYEAVTWINNPFQHPWAIHVAKKYLKRVSLHRAVRAESINDVTLLGGGGQDFCDVVWRRGGGGVEDLWRHKKIRFLLHQEEDSSAKIFYF